LPYLNNIFLYMSRYRGPKLKLIKRLGILPGFSTKIIPFKSKTAGEHGKFIFKNNESTSIKDYYRIRLIEKQRLKFNYGLTEKQLINYYKNNKKKKNSGFEILKMLESRLDSLVFKLGFGKSINNARQLIVHGHILVNNKKITIPNFICKKLDKISYKKSSRELILTNLDYSFKLRKSLLNMVTMKKDENYLTSNFLSKLPSHLEIISKENRVFGHFLGNVKRKDVVLPIDEFKIIEYYSK